ncbi:MAG TPA: glycosyltransferase family 39 protein [Gaiellaceae bacterium]|nr:glycosyltransferase family 39 protein [Gaiellaceae bacterium]
MAVDAASSTRALGAARIAAVPARYALAAIVGLSFVVRLAAVLAHATPLYFPDEYIYGTLARSLAETGKLAIRGQPAHFPALLEPLLASPFWLFHDPMLAYRLTLGLNALAMSLAAIPVYLLARRLGLGAGLALAAGALAVASPDLLFASFLLADPIAYPLVLTALYLAVRALEKPTWKLQVAFVAVAGLAAFARIQYAVLPFAFIAAALLVERGRLRRYWPTFALLLVPVVGVVALGPSRVLGYYTQVPHANVPVLAALKWAAIDTMMLAYSAGWILIPGALVGLALALVRPRTRIELAFGAMALFLAGGIFVEAAVYAARGATRYQERYLFALLPLVALAFGLYVKRGWPHRLAVAVVSLAMLLLSVRVPLSGFTAADNKQDSPFLFAVFRLEALLSVGTGTLIVAIAAGILSVLAVALVGRKHAAAIVLSLAGLACVLASLGSFVFDRANAANVRASDLPRDLTWIDRSGLKDVSLVQTMGAPRGRATDQLFWNRSVTRVTLLPGAEATDAFGATPITVTGDGRMVAGRDPITGPILFESFAARAEFTGAQFVGRGVSLELYKPVGTPRLSLLVAGLYTDGWLAHAGRLTVWPDKSGRTDGTLTLRFWLPKDTQLTPMILTAPGVKRTVMVPSGGSRTVVFHPGGKQPWVLHYRTTKHPYLDDGREISVKLDAPELVRRSP